MRNKNQIQLGECIMIDMNAWKEYYSNPENIKRIVNECKYRECCIFKRESDDKTIPIRPLKIFKVVHLQWLIKFYNLDKHPFDIYITNSCIRLPKLLPPTLNNNKINQETVNQLWNSFYAGDAPDFLTQMDFFTDIDVSSPDEYPLALEWSKQLRKSLEITFGYIESWSTGSGGIHLIKKKISYTPGEVQLMVEKVCYDHDIPFLLGEHDTPHVDAGMYQYRRIRRCPFSIHSFYGKTMNRISDDILPRYTGVEVE